MSDPQQPTFLVSANSDPVVIRIDGKANYLNCNSFREFIERMLARGRYHILVDFEHCRGMDSTFLGIMAGTALELKKQTPPGALRLCNLSERNQELIVNLGLQHLLKITDADGSEDTADGFANLKNEEISDSKNILRAHENLAEADEENATKFQDVISFLKNQVEQDKSK